MHQPINDYGMQEHVFETTIAGITIQAPQLDINTVAAGRETLLKRTGSLRTGSCTS